MIPVPKEFQQPIKVTYPPNNTQIFEEWYIENHDPKYDTERELLPIYFNAYFVNNNYGHNKKALNRLQDFIDSLDRNRPMYVICQYDDGILVDLSKHNIKKFYLGNPDGDYPLPLICKPHPYTFTSERDIFCNFMGALTHQIRKDILPYAKRAWYLVITNPMPIYDYCLNLSRSWFTLCPRGYGVTSFRMMEAIQYGSIPVYISDKPMIPHNEGFDYGVLIEPKDIPNIEKILRSIPYSEVQRKWAMLPEVFNNMFSYEGCKERILRHI